MNNFKRFWGVKYLSKEDFNFEIKLLLPLLENYVIMAKSNHKNNEEILKKAQKIEEFS